MVVWIIRVRCLGPEVYTRCRTRLSLLNHALLMTSHTNGPIATVCTYRRWLDPGEIAYRLRLAIGIAVDPWRHKGWIRNRRTMYRCA